MISLRCIISTTSMKLQSIPKEFTLFWLEPTSFMGHRHFFSTPQSSGMGTDQNRNHHPPGPHINLENTAVSGLNTMACLNHLSLRSNELHFPSFNPSIPTYGPVNAGASHDPYLNVSSASSSSRVPQSYVLHGPPCYNQFTSGGMSNSIDPLADFGRAPFKRKNPSFPMGYHSAGSSSNSNAPSYHLQPELMQGSQCWPRDPITVEPSCPNNGILIVGEGSQRNVRSRHSHGFHLELNPTGSHPLSIPAHRMPTPSVYGPAETIHQWSRARVPSSDIVRSNREMNQTQVVNCVTASSMGTNGGYHSTPNLSTNPSNAFPTPQGPTTGVMGLGHSSYRQRTTSHRPTPSYRSSGFSSVMDDSRRPGAESVTTWRHHSRPLSIAGRSSERIGRGRNMHGRFQSFPNDENNRSRWVSEGIAVMDRSTYDSRNLFDQHRDMRLDIDHMGYEELLALGERIGNVSTGLPEETVSKCLTEMIYCSALTQDEEEEVHCVICMEEYKDRDGLAKLRCGHEFHSSCIKKWLQIKNTCPICKASSLEDNES